MVLKDVFPPGWNPEAPPLKTVNGLLDPPIKARPGEYQIWEVGNLGADSYFDLALDGHELWTIERDGNVQTQPSRQTSLLMPPGSRATVVVRAGAPGSYALRSRAVDRGPAGELSPEVVVGRVYTNWTVRPLPAAQSSTCLIALLRRSMPAELVSELSSVSRSMRVTL